VHRDIPNQWDAWDIDRHYRRTQRSPTREAPSTGLPRSGEDSDQPESLDRVTFLGQLGHRGIDPAAGEVIDVQSLDDLP